MSENKKITIEKREFKVSNGEKFILEYPSNFEEIANRKLSKIQQEYDMTKSNNLTQNVTNNDMDEKDKINIDNNYYQQVGELKSENINENKKVKLEPQEGFIEINHVDNSNTKKDNIDEEDEEINSDDFYEVEEKENKEKKKDINKIDNNIEINNTKKEKKRGVSPVKDPDDIKLSMKKLNFKAPKWAENMNDDDFIKMAKNKLKKDT